METDAGRSDGNGGHAGDDIPAPMSSPSRPRRALRLKYAADRVLAGVGLVALSPVLGGIALWILLESGRPVLFAQARVGEGGRIFSMYKFRSMVHGAIELGQSMKLTEDPYGITPDDPRITRSGDFLRRTSLDELPQLINVLRGEMSLVGPRADMVEQVANYAPEDRRRLAVRPGITGWAQVNGRDSISWPQRFELDAWYIENWSPALDVKIVLRTFAEIFREQPEPIPDTMNIERAKQARLGEGADS
jgi:lipopolysaccharide/colanic/teichoic acid biosynthesis glycosyltransferase